MNENIYLYDNFKTIMENSFISIKKSIEILLSDSKFYDALVSDPEFFIGMYNDYRKCINQNIDIPGVISISPEHLRKYNDEEITTIFKTIRKLFPGYLSKEHKELLNQIFGAIGDDYSKFEKFFKYVSDCEYNIWKNEQYPILDQSLTKLENIKTFDPISLIHNEFITADMVKSLYEDHKDWFDKITNKTTQYTYFHSDYNINYAPLTTEKMKKLNYLLSKNLIQPNATVQAIPAIRPDCDLNVVIEYLRMYAYDIRYYTADIFKYTIHLMEKIPALIDRIGGDDFFLNFVRNNYFDIAVMYKFMIYDKNNSPLKLAIIDRYNKRNSKIYLDTKLSSEEEIVSYIRLFGRKTNCISDVAAYSPGETNSRLFKIACENDIKLSKSSQMFDIQSLGIYGPPDTAAKELQEYTRRLSDSCSNYGCNSRVFLEFANDAKTLSVVDPEKIVGDELKNRYKQYVLTGVL